MKSNKTFVIEKNIPIPTNVKTFNVSKWDGIEIGDSIYCENLNYANALKLSLNIYFKSRELNLALTRKVEGTGYRVWVIAKTVESVEESNSEGFKEELDL